MKDCECYIWMERDGEMERVIGNIDEYVICALGVAGELKVKNIGKMLPYTETYVLRTTARMLEDGYIRKYVYPDAKYYRLSDKGVKLLSEISPELKLHFDLMCGSDGERYKGSKDKRRKKRRVYELAEMCLSEGYTVDHIKLTENSLMVNTPEEIDEILNSVPKGEKTFLTNRMIYGIRDTLLAHPGTHMYRTTGILLSEGNVYTTYYLTAPGERWWKDVEGLYVSALSQSLTRSYLEGNIMRPAAIFYVAKEKVLNEFLFPERKAFRLTPNTIYNIAYMIPMDKNPGTVTNLLLTKDWKDKTNNLLISNPGNGNGDGTDSEGNDVYNFLGCNIGLMQRKAQAIKAVGGSVIIHDWQIDVARKMFGDTTMMVVEHDMLKEIIKDINAKD